MKNIGIPPKKTRVSLKEQLEALDKLAQLILPMQSHQT